MKTALLRISIFFYAFNLHGQFSFPITTQSPIWRVDVSSNVNLPAVKTLYYFGQDTLICGKQWNSMILFDSTSSNEINIGYLRHEGDKLFARHNADCLEDEYLIYDFSVEVGDSSHLSVNPYGEIQMKVYEIEILNYNGIDRKTIYLKNIAVNYGNIFLTWVEGIGCKEHPFYAFFDISGWAESAYYFQRLELLDEIIYTGDWDSSDCLENFNGVKYVNKNSVNGNNDGTSWENAFLDLQSALNDASFGDSIWVAEGVYYPTINLDRQISFELPKGVAIYGGFNGTETLLYERDFENNLTVLSGDIGLINEKTDNSYHVINASYSDSTSIFDGFTVTNGYAFHPDFSSNFNYGGGLYLSGSLGTGSNSPKINNCVFLLNSAKKGAAVYLESGVGEEASPIFNNCQFISNKSTQKGGAIYKSSSSGNISNYSILNCLFDSNVATLGGGAIYFDNSKGSINLINCEFTKDSSQLDGGAILFENSSNTCDVLIKNCNFFNNAGADGGAIRFLYLGFSTEADFNFNIQNSTFDNNRSKNNQGGAIALGSLGNSLMLEIDSCHFLNNKSVNGGGAIYLNNNCSSDCTNLINVRNSVFKNNSSSINTAGGIYYQGYGGEGPNNVTQIYNSIFDSNTGAVTLLSGYLGKVDAFVKNCTFYNNGQFPFHKNYDPDFNDFGFYSNMEVVNCIIQEYTPIQFMFYNNDPVNYTIIGYDIHHCLVNVPDCLVDTIDACGDGMLYQTPPLFIDTLNSNLSLASCSPCINSGDNTAIANTGLLTDIEGNIRINESLVDMGAFERPFFKIEHIDAVAETCEGSYDGSVNVETNGNPPYNFSWTNDQGNSGNLNDSLEAGIYQFIILDAFGCTDTFSITLEHETSITVSGSVTNASSFDSHDGTIMLNAIEGGVSPYSILWETGDTSQSLENLLPGDYDLTVTDAAGCAAVFTFTIDFVDFTKKTESQNVNTSIVPNPSGASGAWLLIESETEMRLWLRVLDGIGREVLSERPEIICGHKTKLPKGLPPGLYQVLLETENRVIALLKWVVVD